MNSAQVVSKCLENEKGSALSQRRTNVNGVADEELTNALNLGILGFLDEDEKKWWAEEIQRYRRATIQAPQYYVGEAFAQEGLTGLELSTGIDSAIEAARRKSYSLYLEDEAKLHAALFEMLARERKVPRSILSDLSSRVIGGGSFDNATDSERTDRLSLLTGEYVGRIFPYVYQLCLSTTQSRRSRAGREFELIIERILQEFAIEHEAQSTIGTENFDRVGLGKAVDFLVPGTYAYQNQRTRCAVLTVKTTLRERWQQVAEELAATNVPSIYLLTLDDAISSAVAKRIISYNITLVTTEAVKKQKFSEISQVLSFQRFFSHDLKHVLTYWEGGENDN